MTTEIAKGWSELDDTIDSIAAAELGLTAEQIAKIKAQGR